MTTLLEPDISSTSNGALRVFALRSGLITLGTQAGRLCLNIASTAVLARLLTPVDFGLLGMVTAFTGFAALFTDLGLSSATIQRKEITQAQVSNLFWVNVGLGTAVMLLFVLAAPVVAWFYQEPRLNSVVVVLSASFLLAGLAVQHQALMLRRMQFGAVAAVELVAQVTAVVIGVVLAAMKLGVWALVAMQLSSLAARTIGLWACNRWTPSWPVRGADTRALLAFGGHVTGFNTMNYWARHADDVLIGRVWGAAALGLYSRAYGMLRLPLQQINAPITRVAVPLLSRLASDPARYRRAYLGIVEKLLIVTMPLAVLMAVTADWIVALVLGSQWLEAASIFRWLSIAALTQPLSNTTGWLFTTQGRSAEFFRWGILGSAIAVAAIVAGLPWGAVGVAASYAVTDLAVRTPLLYWFVGRRGHVTTRDLYSVFPPACVASGVLLLLLLQVRAMWEPSSPASGLAIAVLLAAVVVPLGTALLPAGRTALRDVAQTVRQVCVPSTI